MAFKRFGSAVAAALVALVPFVAGAATVTVAQQNGGNVFGGNGHASGKIYESTLRPSGVSVNAGAFALKATGMGNFDAFCVDITVALKLSSSYNTGTAPLTTSGMSAADLNDITRLFETGYKSITLSSAVQSAAFQLALWEVLYDESGTFDVTKGNFKVSGFSSSVVTKAQDLLKGLTGPVTQDYKVVLLESPSTSKWKPSLHFSQHLVTVVPDVPLPAAGVLLLGALGGLGLLRRRKA